jgi:tRNA nucleotidyltransferase/poly(A) polymerase
MNALKIDNTLHQNIINILNFFNITDRSFFVGGMVRDHFLNNEIQDIDISVEKITKS